MVKQATPSSALAVFVVATLLATGVTSHTVASPQPTISPGTVVANGMTFSYLAAGEMSDTSRPLALLLHGFPDTPFTWQLLLPQLAEQGYRAVAPFMRGYAPSETASTYQVGALVQDANALHDALGGRFGAGVTKDVIIGHDWGAIAAFGSDISSEFVPEEMGTVRWSKVVSLGVPPASGVFVNIAIQGGHYEQIKKSYYFWFFGHSTNSNIAFSANNFNFIDRIWSDWSAPGFDPSFYTAQAKRSLQLPANSTAALDYYRATVWGLAGIPGTTFECIYPGINAELTLYDLAGLGTDGTHPLFPNRATLYLQGTKDQVFADSVIEQAVLAAQAIAPDFRVIFIRGANHFLHLEQPNLVNRHILDFLKE
jgi:pimeloyl-ACP methyl ester carboxylesterase